MKTSVIDKSMKTYLDYDETDTQMVEFKKAYLKYKKNIAPLPDTIKKVEGKSGFVGSGSWVYEMNGVKFRVSGYPNGRTFWGTNYSISRVK